MMYVYKIYYSVLLTKGNTLKPLQFLSPGAKIALVTALLTLSFSSIASSPSHSYSSGFSKSSSSSSASPSRSYSAPSVAPSSTRSTSFSSYGSAKKTESIAHSTSSVTPSSSKSSGFGSFGGANKTESTTSSAPQSTMSKGLDKNASQANALKTLNEREAAKVSHSGFGNSSKDTAFTPSKPIQQPQPQNSQTIPAPVYQAPVSSGNNGFSLGSAAVGFMLGRATSHEPKRDYEPTSHTKASEDVSTSPIQQSNSSDEVSASSNHTASSGSNVLRIALWLLIFGGIAWAIWRFFFKKADIAKSNHYSLR